MKLMAPVLAGQWHNKIPEKNKNTENEKICSAKIMKLYAMRVSREQLNERAGARQQNQKWIFQNNVEPNDEQSAANWHSDKFWYLY